MADSPLQASEVTPQKVKWLWGTPASKPGGPGLIARGVIHVVAGRPDQGKGLFAAHLAADISTGTGLTANELRGTGGRVLYSAAEDDARMMTRPRLEAAGANLKNIMLWRFVLPANAAQLEKILRDQKIDLLVLDPFAAHLSGVSRHSDKIRDLLNPLTKVIEETGTAVVIVEHALKKVKKGGHPLDAIGGSGSGLPAAARMAYLFGVDPDDDERRVLAPVKANLREKPKAIAFEVDVDELPIVGEMPSLQYKTEIDSFDPNRLVVADKDANGDGLGRKPDKRAHAAEWLTNYLVDKGEPVKSGLVQEDGTQAGLTKKTLRRAADDLRIVRNPPGGGRNCTWDLPDDVKQVFGITITQEPITDTPHEAAEGAAKVESDVNDAFNSIVEGFEAGEANG